MCAQPLQQLWRGRTVGEMLEKGGTGFCEVLNPALEYLQASDDDMRSERNPQSIRSLLGR